MSAGAGTPSIETRELTIRFGGHVAVDQVSCEFLPGTRVLRAKIEVTDLPRRQQQSAALASLYGKQARRYFEEGGDPAGLARFILVRRPLPGQGDGLVEDGKLQWHVGRPVGTSCELVTSG